jgi:hypothetical protein
MQPCLGITRFPYSGFKHRCTPEHNGCTDRIAPDGYPTAQGNLSLDRYTYIRTRSDKVKVFQTAAAELDVLTTIVNVRHAHTDPK